MAFFRGDVLAAVLAAAQAPAKAGDVARRILQDPAYQSELPKGPPPPDPVPPDHEFVLGPLFQLIAYIALAVVIALAIAWAVRRFAAGGDEDVELPVDGDARAPLQVETAGPERLAAAGRYADAIHALLLETLAALARAGQLPLSYTSREILERVRLPARARDALSGLVLAVEVSRFGGVPAGEADYRICLDRFHAFLESYRRPKQEAAA